MKKNQIFLITLEVFAMLGAAVYAYLGNFTRMLADDFCAASLVNRLGLLRTVWYAYRIWNGRFAAYSADGVMFKFTLGVDNLNYFVPLLLALWLLFLTLFIYLQFRRKSASAFLHALVASTSFIFIFLLLSPNIPQSLFWWNAARSYALPLMLVTFSAFLLYAFRQISFVPAKAIYGLSFILFFFIGGTGETYLVGQGGLLAFLIFLEVAKQKRDSQTDLWIFISGLAGTFAALIIVLLAPGNAVRRALLPPTPDLLTLILVSAKSYAIFLHDLFANPIQVSALIGALLLSVWMGIQYKEYISTNIKLIALNFSAGIALSFLCFLPGVYGFSEPPPDRTFTIPLFFLLILTLRAGYLFGGWVSNSRTDLRPNENWLAAIILVLITVSSVVNSARLWSERQEYYDFAAKWDVVDRQILDAKSAGMESVQIPEMTNWAFLEVPAGNPKHWVNRCYNVYYGIEVYGPPIKEIMEIYNIKRGSD